MANGSEAKIADCMLRVLHQQGVLGEAATDLRFNMRPGGNPGRGEYGGVVEAFHRPGSGAIDLRNRFGEPVRGGARRRQGSTGPPSLRIARELSRRSTACPTSWRRGERIGASSERLEAAAGRSARTFVRPRRAAARARQRADRDHPRALVLGVDDYRYLVDAALPSFAARGEAARAAAMRVLTELRKRVALADLGGKALSSIEYLTDGGRAADGAAEGGIYRVLDAVPPLATRWRCAPRRRPAAGAASRSPRATTSRRPPTPSATCW